MCYSDYLRSLFYEIQCHVVRWRSTTYLAIGFFFDHEDEREMPSETSVDFQRTTRHNILKYITLLTDDCEILEFLIPNIFFLTSLKKRRKETAPDLQISHYGQYLTHALKSLVLMISCPPCSGLVLLTTCSPGSLSFQEVFYCSDAQMKMSEHNHIIPQQ
jgi:hypothetical protein